MPSAPPARVVPHCLSIVAWNDLHGQIAPDDPTIDTGKIPAGGVIALADEVAAERAAGDSVVLLDAGDLFTGPLESTLAEGAPIIEAYNLIGVDAVALGNHEFDFGPVGYARVTATPGLGDEAGDDGPRGALFQRMKEAKFPFLSANLHRATGETLNWQNYAPSTIIHRDGFDVGVVGYTTRDTPTTTLKRNVLDLDFATNAALSVAAQIRELRAKGASPIVLLAHASIEGVLPEELDEPSDPSGAKRTGEMASLVAALGPDRPDVIVAGHRHAWLLGRVLGIPIVSSDQHAVGAARIRFCANGNARDLVSIDRHVAIASSPPRSQLGTRVAAAMKPWLDAVKSKADAIVATLPHACPAQALDGARTQEQIAHAIAEHAKDAAVPPKGVPVVALTNAGGVRATLAEGPLRYADLFTAFPFENAVSVCGTTRAGLKRVLENGINKPSVGERFPFGVWAAKVTFARRASDGGLTLLHFDVDGLGKSDDAPVWLAIPDFILDGGDALLHGVTCVPQVASTTRVRDAWREQLAAEHGGCDGAAKNVVVVHAK